MSDDGRPPTTTAQSPFDNVDADIVLHTPDHVDFHVFRLILTLSSPFFQGMFALPQPSDVFARANSGSPNAHDSWHDLSDWAALKTTPSVDVPEDSQTLDTLLRFLYPNTHVLSMPFHDLLHARNVAVAASKYDMSAALDKIADKVQTQYVASRPFDVYFIACRMGWEDVAKAAAKYCLDPATTRGDKSDDDGLVRSGGVLDYPGASVAYHRLEAYRYACRRAIEEKVGDMSLPDCGPFCCKEEEGEVDEGISGHCLSLWIVQYLANIKLALSVCPREDTLGDLSLLPEANCKRCNIVIVPVIATAQLEVASQVEDVLSEVRLPGLNE